MKKNIFMLVAMILGTSNLWALDKVGEVYQIGTAAELVEFASIVNGGENGANAVLTADIDMTGVAWTTIGTTDKRYVGTFDGQGHVIDNLVYEGGENAGIFGVVDGGVVIKNLIAGPHNVIKGTSKVGGIIGRSDGAGWVKLENVGHEGRVEGTGANCCAIIGVVMNGGPATEIVNCYNTGNIKAGNESAIITGWFGGHGSVRVSNFWNSGQIEAGGDGDNYLYRNNSGLEKWENIYSINDKQGATVINNDDMASGKFAFQLNGNADAGVWLQNLEGENDVYPNFRAGHGKVYANGELKCNGDAKGTVTYSNHEGSTRDAHNFADGFCTVCGEYQADFLTPDAEGFYEIANSGALTWFAYTVNRVNGAANGKLTADIDMSGVTGYTPIGQDAHDFKGHFDGQGHRILNLTTTAGYNNQALFGQAVGPAIIENVIIDKSCNIQGAAFTAGILGHVWGDGVIVRNCGNEADIKGTAQNAAGIIGCSERKVAIIDCYNTGKITGSHENAGICAWMGSNASTIKNCYSTATDVNGEALWRKTEVQGENVYQIEGKQGTAFTTEQLQNGELAFLLNGKVDGGTWHQALPGDDHPVPFGADETKVYANGELTCGGDAKPGSTITYSNTPGATQDPHNFVDGFCTACGAYDPAFMTANGDGFFEVGEPNQLVWVAAMSKDNTAVKVLLANDLDMAGVAYEGIGADSDGKRFNGVIDGQFHVVKNLTMDFDRQSVGFVNAATVGAAIRNLTFDASCSFKGSQATAAFIGAVRNGNGQITIDNCGNEAPVTTANQNAGAIIGCNYVGEVKIILTNVYNTGAIKSGWEAGGLSGWFGNNAEMHNVYNAGTVENGESFGRGNNIQFNGTSYDVNSTAGGINAITEVEISDGTLLAALSDNVWHQQFGEKAHPVLNAHYDFLETFKGQNLNNYDNTTVTLRRSVVADTWNTLCLPFNMTAEQLAEVFGEGAKVAGLTGEEGDVLQFTSITTGVEAGKPYLLWPTKAFTADEPAVIEGVNVSTTAAKAEAVDDGSELNFVGIYEPAAPSKYDLFVAAGNKLMNNAAGTELKGMRAYFKDVREHLPVGDDDIDNPGDVLSKWFSVDGDFTGIVLTDGTVETIQSVYTIDGKAIAPAQMNKGVYVVNGKKVVIK